MEKHNGRSSKVSSISGPEEPENEDRRGKPSTKWKKTIHKVNSQQRIINALDNSEHHSHAGHLQEGRHVKLTNEPEESQGRFREAARKVRGGERRPTPRLQTVAEQLRDLETSESGEEAHPTEHLGPYTRHSESYAGREQEIEEKVERRLKESAEILIKKMAELQYEENLRHSQEIIRTALERASAAQERGSFLKSVEKRLRTRLHQDLHFRSVAEPLSAPQQASRALVPVDTESSDRELLKQLSREREWREKADKTMKEQEQRIEQLRRSMQEDIKKVLHMQAKQFGDVKKLIGRSSRASRRTPSDQAYVSLDASTQSSSNRGGGAETKRRNEQRKARLRDDWESDERRSRSSTPGFYIQ